MHYAVLQAGDQNSKSPELSDTITAHFHGTLVDGTVFWSSVELSEPLTIQLSGLIEGCQKIISMMKLNDKWRVYIDPSMAYGDEGRPGIPSNSILVFDIELLELINYQSLTKHIHKSQQSDLFVCLLVFLHHDQLFLLFLLKLDFGILDILEALLQI